ncbi:uncharacterized protein LOC143019508 [Oratosquilla oratoria]|uniref:uncharacterized protein LOC143019508 n=1 Tax=Oratosquilla oratoria TaxID=337810 RepID=UPI003F76CCA1
MYFPRPLLPHAHAHSYHAHAPHARLKVLTQPSSSDCRRRKRYLAELGNDEAADDSWDNDLLLPRRPRPSPRRPISAPPDPQHTPEGSRSHSSPERGEVSRGSPRGGPESPSNPENRSPRSPSRSLSPAGSAFPKRRSSSRGRSHRQRYSLDSDDSPEDDFASEDDEDDLDYVDHPLCSSRRYRCHYRSPRLPGYPCGVCGLVCSCVYCLPLPRRRRRSPRRMVHY